MACGDSTLRIFLVLHSIVPALVVLYDRIRPSILWYNVFLHALFRAVRYRSRTGTVPLVYWYGCTPSCLHSSCCTTAYSPVYCGTNRRLRALLRAVRSRIPWDNVRMLTLVNCTMYGVLLHSSCARSIVLYVRVLHAGLWTENEKWLDRFLGFSPKCRSGSVGFENKTEKKRNQNRTLLGRFLGETI